MCTSVRLLPPTAQGGRCEQAGAGSGSQCRAARSGNWYRLDEEHEDPFSSGQWSPRHSGWRFPWWAPEPPPAKKTVKDKIQRGGGAVDGWHALAG